MPDKKSSMKHRVSVILPTYNRAGLIDETIRSLMAQIRRPDEILIIDDGSTDDTASVLAKYDELTVVRIQNSGKAAALNHAFKMVSGDLIWILDDDDLLQPEACAVLSAPLESDPALDFCAGKYLDFEVDPKTGEKHIRSPGYMRTSTPEQIFPDLLEGCHIFQPGLMVRRRVYDEVGPFDTGLIRSQDYEMLLRISRNYRGLQVPDIVFLHREHKGVRGTATKSFAASSNSDTWAAYNRVIFSRLLEDLADKDMVAPSDLKVLAADIRPRAARIKRGCVLARQRMWPEAIAAWHEAAEMCNSPLTNFEREMLLRSPNSSLGAPELFTSPHVRANFAALRRMPKPGPQIAKIVRHAARWHIRAAVKSRDWRFAINGVKFIIGK